MPKSIIFDSHEEWTNNCYYFGLLLVPAMYILYAIDKYHKLGECRNGKTLTKVPPYIHVFGHMFELIPEKFLNSLQNWKFSQGSLVDVFIFNQRMRIVSDCNLAIELMQKRPTTFRRGKTMAEAFEHLDIGIPLTASEGERWAHLRRVASPQFNHKNISSLIYLIQEEAQSVASSIECGVITQGTDMCTLYAASTIGRLTLGIEAEDMKEYFGTKQLVQDLDIFVNYLIERMFYPLPKWTWKYSKAYHLEVEAREANARMDYACKTHIQNIREKLSDSSVSSSATPTSIPPVNRSSKNRNQSLIELLISSNDKELMSDEDCILNVKTFLGAGADTTGIATTWVLYYLALHPECVVKMREELKILTLRQGLGLDCPLSFNSYEEVLQLKYAFAVVKEAIRLKSPAAINILELNSEIAQYSCSNGMVILPGDQVCIDYDGILKNPDVFPEPDRFNPDRWLCADKESLIKMEKHYVSFGAGPRKCPAFSMAHVEVVICIATLVSRFNWNITCPIPEIKRVLQFTAKANKLPLIFQPYKQHENSD